MNADCAHATLAPAAAGRRYPPTRYLHCGNHGSDLLRWHFLQSTDLGVYTGTWPALEKELNPQPLMILAASTSADLFTVLLTPGHPRLQ